MCGATLVASALKLSNAGRCIDLVAGIDQSSCSA
jgi:hypothetical protein